MERLFDPDWFAQSLGMPFERLALFPFGAVLVFWTISRLMIIPKSHLGYEKSYAAYAPNFIFGFLTGIIVIVAILALFEMLFSVQILPFDRNTILRLL